MYESVVDVRYDSTTERVCRRRRENGHLESVSAWKNAAANVEIEVGNRAHRRGALALFEKRGCILVRVLIWRWIKAGRGSGR